jgi:iron complex outermembrane receptor protein
LTLFNGHRLPAAFAFSPDPNKLPLAAIGRVEVLKDGAAATYGSDAIGGVVNFITRRSFDGLEVSGDYRQIDGSTATTTAPAPSGASVSATSTSWPPSSTTIVPNCRCWARTGRTRPMTATPRAVGPAAATPKPSRRHGDRNAACRRTAGPRLHRAGRTAHHRQCERPPLLPWTSCRGQYSIWDNLEEKEDSYQGFAQVNWKFAEGHELHLDAAYGYTNLPFFKSSPSYVTTRPVPFEVLPTGFNTLAALTVAGPPKSSLAYFVPVTNPGFAPTSPPIQGNSRPAPAGR